MNSSPGESTAPLDFQIPPSCKDDKKLIICDEECHNGKEECPLCLKASKNFYCKNCVNNGLFYHSKGNSSNRFENLKLRMFKLLTEKRITERICHEGLKSKLNICMVRTEIELIRERNEGHRKVIGEINRSISKKRELIIKTKSDIGQKHLRLQRYDLRVYKLRTLVNEGHKKMSDIKESVFIIEQALKKARCYNIRQLLTYIFPLFEIKATKKQGAGSALNVLEEAYGTIYTQRQRYVHKKSERQHLIVGPTVLASGDYSAYKIFVDANIDVPKSSDSINDVFNPASSICGALTYTAQLVEMLAYYLDVILPAKLRYGDFTCPAIIESKFTKRVARLNLNILHLCLSQNVDPHLLKPETTLSNLLLLLDHNFSDLGRSVTPNEHLENSKLLEEALGPFLGEDDPDISNDDGISRDWVAVSKSLPESEPGPASPSMSASTITGGLLTSTAASLASMFGWNR